MHRTICDYDNLSVKHKYVNNRETFSVIKKSRDLNLRILKHVEVQILFLHFWNLKTPNSLVNLDFKFSNQNHEILLRIKSNS